MGTILLFHVNIMKTGQIAALCQKLDHNLISVPKKHYNKTLSVLAQNQQISEGKEYQGEDFAEDMMVFSGLDSQAMDGFLKAYQSANIAPILRKATLTATNANWTPKALYKELDEHVRLGM